MIALAGALAAPWGRPVHAGEPDARVYVKDSEQAKARLQTADAYIGQRKWGEALDVLERVIDRFPDSVYPLDAYRYISLRDYCHRRIAQLPPEGLALYRRRVDVAMDARFAKARAQRDVDALERLVDEGLCASVGDDTLDLLGELAFERGEFHVAREYWRRILEVYPDPSVDRAWVQAKATLCLMAMGRLAEAKLALADLAKHHPQARGRLAGREGRFVAILEQVMREPTFRAPGAAGREDWPTLGGSARRTAVARHPVEKGGFQWLVELRDRKAVREFRRRPGTRRMPWRRRVVPSREDLLSFHPIIVGDEVIVCDATTVLGIHLHTGKRRWYYNVHDRPPSRARGAGAGPATVR